jgi:hypothetical protein
VKRLGKVIVERRQKSPVLTSGEAWLGVSMTKIKFSLRISWICFPYVCSISRKPPSSFSDSSCQGNNLPGLQPVGKKRKSIFLITQA